MFTSSTSQTFTPVGVSASSAAPDCLVLMIHSIHAMSNCKAMGVAPRTNASPVRSGLVVAVQSCWRW